MEFVTAPVVRSVVASMFRAVTAAPVSAPIVLADPVEVNVFVASSVLKWNAAAAFASTIFTVPDVTVAAQPALRIPMSSALPISPAAAPASRLVIVTVPAER